MELDFSFGMRRYQVLIIEERRELPMFNRTVGRYELSKTLGEGGGIAVEKVAGQLGSEAEKGKKPVDDSSVLRTGGGANSGR